MTGTGATTTVTTLAPAIAGQPQGNGQTKGSAVPAAAQALPSLGLRSL